MKASDVNLEYNEREEELISTIQRDQKAFEDSMNDDLDTHGALDALHSMSRSINSYLEEPANKGVILKASTTYRKLLNALGFFEKRTSDTGELTDKLLDILSEVRDDLRKEKNYAQADKIRDALNEAGVTLVDTADGPRWKVK